MKIKICGITRLEDAQLCAKHGVDAIGFIFHPKSKRFIKPEEAKVISILQPPFMHRIGVFVDEEIEIKFTEALELDPDAQAHDSIGAKLETDSLGRIAAQMAKQIITQKVRDAERDNIFAEFESRKGDIGSGIARRVERRAVVVDLGRIEAYIPPREQIPGEQLKPGDRIQGFISDVRQTNRGPQIIMTRAHEDYLAKLFEIEVPEIQDGTIEIRPLFKMFF